MSDGLLYDFNQNYTAIEDVHARLRDIEEVRGDIAGIFNTLASVYEGEGASALHEAHINVSAMMDEAINNTVNTQKQAEDQQDTMKAMDLANAAQLQH